MAARFSVVFAIGIALVPFNVGSTQAAGKDNADIPVAYALFLDGKDAIYGQFNCQIHVRCQLIENQDTHIQLSITIDSNRYLAGDISVQCGDLGCSFLTWKTSTRLEGVSDGKKVREFDLYAGENNSVAMDLVQRKRTKIGRILLLAEHR
ncbi:hypothetical protein [Rhizobium leucaenae]|uniref:DUF2195 family protein n=1 Tax=Rhizobium leucaenae TaxID=29450 RepID=A0A7W6ZVI4_9HYPH|nr:hypothetical protein [Rhizobium leucaenae]MBB4569481.1 hypothetical protein [Rhizobium leucaenae]MBB6299561.1 hypothetical protein [Rhizobium leucaenae]